ncbi:Protein-S-isoprenylcysteine O-methyltransferase Ste14 [Fulvimarina manganoxydans]|uniref:Protein-S-isoprenylcysteine O-methyltransferase Ste14 n=1 Tax=Fulvimarina manganoxydans TaxID=937218 RepID=A0A1W1ZT17_9HYPH|nr:isoprenylcysteine carboxylmethyltransferase family protein [Fulvimarina manganoxydans]SMC51201.1 Protein-S-isoprenylcysteine O-methyltransferase Ste14 [Fulvimarina manganoxydans]
MALRERFPDLPPIWAAGFALAGWGLAQVLPVVDFASSLAAAIGVVLSLAGFLLAAWAAVWFSRKKTSIEPGERPTSLIVEGPFRVNRNPIYTGMALVLIGIAFWLGAMSALALALLFPFVITARFIRDEEASLRVAFGAEAEAYLRRTRRW